MQDDSRSENRSDTLEERPPYRLLEPIGRGRIGDVHLAEALEPDLEPRQVAVALLDPCLTRDPEALGALRAQVDVLARLEHPNIARTLGLARFGEGWGLVMEYARGLDLDLYRVAGPLPPRVAAEILEQTATALRAALELPLPGAERPLGLCHGDLVPSLVRLDSTGRVKVCGFGLSAAEGPDPSFAAPERAAGGAGPRADVFSLGLIAARLLSGRDLPAPPHDPDALGAFVASALEAVKRRLHAELTAGARFSVEPLLMMLEAMLDPEPARRPTAARVQLGCRSLLGVLPGPWLEPWATQRLPEFYERAAAYALQRDPTGGIANAGDLREEVTGEEAPPAPATPEAPAPPISGGEPIPGEPIPGEPIPGEPIPGEPIPGEPMPGEPIPGEPLAAGGAEAPVGEGLAPDPEEASTGGDLADAEDVSEHLEESPPELAAAAVEPIEDMPTPIPAAKPVPAPAESAVERERTEPGVRVPSGPLGAVPAAAPMPAPSAPPARSPTGASRAEERSSAPWWTLGFAALALITVVGLWMGGLLGQGEPAPGIPAPVAGPPAVGPVERAMPQPAGPEPEPVPPPDASPPTAEAATPAPEPPAAPGPRPRRQGRLQPESVAPPAAAPPTAAAPVAEPIPGEPIPGDPAPKPADPAASGSGSATQAMVRLEGDATRVLLQTGGGSFPVGLVPAGTYSISAWFGGDAPVPAGTVRVVAGETVTLRCSSMMLRCSRQ